MEQSQRLARLIEAMLDLSRIENVQLLINPAMHNLLATITHTVKTQAITSKRHTIRLTLDGLQPGDRLMAYYDEDRIDQVLNNLISNATKYSSPGSEIEVGLSFTEKKSRQALIWVKDHGVGIASSELPHIFKRFHRASNFDRSISGLGIGLYLVQELMTRHGGKVWAESIEGHGSTFYVTLPLFTGQI
jgi:signal transduction histidine kinase